jgi:hypothetical protein
MSFCAAVTVLPVEYFGSLNLKHTQAASPVVLIANCSSPDSLPLAESMQHYSLLWLWSDG